MKNGYELFVRPLLFSLDAETAHHVTMRLLGSASHFDIALRALKSFQPTVETENSLWSQLPKPYWTCGWAGQKRCCSSCVGGARVRFYRDWDRDGKGAAWKPQAAHFSIARATSADQSAWFQQRRRGRDCAAIGERCVKAADGRPFQWESTLASREQRRSNKRQTITFTRFACCGILPITSR